MRLMAAPNKAPALSYGSTGGYVPPSFASVEEGLAIIDRGGPENLTSDTLREDLKWFTIQQRALEAMSARWLAELDRREQQASKDDSRDDFFSCSRWLSETLKLTPNAAYAQVRTARMLEQLPWTAAAFRRGEISSQHVAVIRRAMEQVAKTCLDPSDVEPALVFAARQMDTFNLEQHWQQMRYQADQEAALEAEEERRRQRWLSLRQISTGNYRSETARRLADDASITPVLVDDRGEILHVGRSSRSVPRQLRKGLNLRDRHCLSPGCTTPPELCAVHHRRHWADGGPTDLSNLELRCDVHHGRLHPENHRFRQSRAP